MAAANREAPALGCGISRLPRLAFTLLELLVVIAIIAVLAGIVLPVIGEVRENATAVHDLSNLKQLSGATSAYQADYEMILPGPEWPSSLRHKYLGTWKVLQSPFDQRAPTEEGTTAPVSYDVNGKLWGMRSISVVSPGKCILMAPLMSDPAKRQFLSTAFFPSRPHPLDITSNGAGSAGGTHQNGFEINVLYVDGHAAAMNMGDFHTSEANPDSTATVKDLRWNQ